MLPIVFYSSSTLALFDENLNQACEKDGSAIKVYGGAEPFKQAADTLMLVTNVVRFLMLTVLIYINLVHAQQTRLQLMTFQLVNILLTPLHR